MHRYTLPIALVLFAGCGPPAEEQAAPVFAQGRRHHEAGDLQKAIASYDLALELDPGNTEVYVRRAEAYFSVGDPDSALADYTEAIRLDPHLAEAYKGRAGILVALSNFEAALADLDRAVQLDPTEPAFYRARLHIHRAKRNLAGAESDWEKATKLEYPDQLTGKVAAVADGDTLTILVDRKEIEVRVHGIDCPEDGQPFGTEAKQFTTNRALGRAVSVKAIDTDQHGRTVGRVILSDESDLSELLVKHGMAWHYLQHAPDDETLASLEAAARQGKAGLWSDSKPPIPPWDWREGQRGEAEPADGTVSGLERPAQCDVQARPGDRRTTYRRSG